MKHWVPHSCDAHLVAKVGEHNPHTALLRLVELPFLFLIRAALPYASSYELPANSRSILFTWGEASRNSMGIRMSSGSRIDCCSMLHLTGRTFAWHRVPSSSYQDCSVSKGIEL
jgi:hypothetical protein